MRNFFEEPRLIVGIFIALAIIMISSALIELHQSRNEVYSLMEDQSHSLLESLLIASRNALKYSEVLEEGQTERLLNNANLIRLLYEDKKISDPMLADLAMKNNIYRINIFNRTGKKIYSSHQPLHDNIEERTSPIRTLYPIFNGDTDTLIVGLKPARFEKGYRYTIAIAAEDRSAIVLNIDAAEILDLRRRTGFGALLRDIIGNPGIVYIAVQDTSSILAASGNVNELEPINSSEFLSHSLTDSLFLTRITEFNSISVFEAVHPFVYTETPIGILRLGLSMDALEELNSRIYRRLIVITIVLITLGSIVFTYIFIRQKYRILENQYHIVETYSGDILKNVSDAILVYDEQSGIKIFNMAATELFKTENTNIIGKKISYLLKQPACDDIVLMPPGIVPFECEIGGETKYLLFSKTEFRDHENIVNIILVIRDLTRQRQLENQIQRDERLTAMGELASGVAHEIRNPLNTIGTIAQQLDRDFDSTTNNQEYHELAGLVRNEVQRINKTISDFLRFARPNPPQVSKFYLKEFFHSLEKQYHEMLTQKKIRLNISLETGDEVHWDQEQIRQVFINLIQNAVDALNGPGDIWIKIKNYSNTAILIEFSDDGPGIKAEHQPRIFNLYFTTRAKGTGIGLSLVQRIINEHNGSINLVPASTGTKFAIILPRLIKAGGNL